MAGLKIRDATNLATLAGTENLAADDGTSTARRILINTIWSENTNARVITQGALTDPAVGLSHTATWNDASDTFVGLKSNITDTASAAASLLLDLQVGGSSVATVSKGGIFNSIGTNTVAPASASSSFGNWYGTTAMFYGSAMITMTAARLDLGDIALQFNGGNSAELNHDANHTLGLRNDGSAQTFNVYSDLGNLTNYERLSLSMDTSGNATVATQAGGTGSVGNLILLPGTAKSVEMDKTTEDIPFINFKATADGDATSAISTLTTSGSVTHHIQISLNGTPAWIPVSTTDPS